MQFREGLRRFLMQRLPSEADADDVLQDVFVRLHEGADRLAAVEQVQAWVFTVARRAVADFYRAAYRRVEEGPVEAADGMSPEAPPEVNLASFDGAHDVHEEVLSWIRPLIDELPEPYRTAVYLADVKGLTQQQVADQSGISLSGAKSRVQRGRQMLGEQLRACCEVAFGPEGRAVEFRRRSDRCRTGC